MSQQTIKIPGRISMVTYNLWNTECWSQREPALRKFLTTFNPDILCIQEIRNETIACIADSLPQHQYVKDEQAGWTCESNIFWNSNYFEKIQHGLEELDMPETHRGLFWVRLRLIGSDKSLLVATAHFTWQGHQDEVETGFTQRNQQIRQTIQYLKDIASDDEAVFFMGDLNDPVLPRRLFPEAGYESCFKELNLLSPPTFPALPTTDDIGENQTIDWIFSNAKATALSASVPQLYYQHMAPSDHWPVQAIYQLD